MFLFTMRWRDAPRGWCPDVERNQGYPEADPACNLSWVHSVWWTSDPTLSASSFHSAVKGIDRRAAWFGTARLVPGDDQGLPDRLGLTYAIFRKEDWCCFNSGRCTGRTEGPRRGTCFVEPSHRDTCLVVGLATDFWIGPHRHECGSEPVGPKTHPMAET